jgi:hypothetical protein
LGAASLGVIDRKHPVSIGEGFPISYPLLRIFPKGNNIMTVFRIYAEIIKDPRNIPLRSGKNVVSFYELGFKISHQSLEVLFLGAVIERQDY